MGLFCLEWNLYLTECLERHSKKSRERNKQREIKKDWEKGRELRRYTRWGSVTAVSNECESGKTWSAAQHGGLPGRD